jgi:Ca2+-binding RTX toxin-like protein
MAQEIGSAKAVHGHMTAMGSEGARSLSAGSPVFKGDVVSTAKGAGGSIEFLDHTVLNVGEGSKVSLDQYVYDAAKGSGHALFKMAQGTFRTVTGEIVKHNPESFKMQSPLATIGIRGTETAHTVPAPGTEGVSESHLIMVFDGKPVVVQPLGGGAYQILAQAGVKVEVGKFGVGPVLVMTPQEFKYFQALTATGLQQGVPQDTISPQGQGPIKDTPVRAAQDAATKAAADAAAKAEAQAAAKAAADAAAKAAADAAASGDPAAKAAADAAAKAAAEAAAKAAIEAKAAAELAAKAQAEAFAAQQALAMAEAQAAAQLAAQQNAQDSGQQGSSFSLTPGSIITVTTTGSSTSASGGTTTGGTGNAGGTTVQVILSESAQQGDQNTHETTPPPTNTTPTTHPDTTLDLSSAETSLYVSLLSGYYMPSGGVSTAIASSITNIIGSDHGDTIIGNDADNSLVGGAGDDSIAGGAGNDTIIGGEGNNTLVGGAGNDSIVGGDGVDVIYTNAGNDTVSAGGGGDLIDATNSGVVHIDAGAGSDSIFMSASLTGQDTVDGGAGYDLLYFTDNGLGTDDLAHVRGVEKIELGDAPTAIVFPSYTAADWAAIGGSIVIDGHSLSASSPLFFDGSAAGTLGTFDVTGGAGDDTIQGGGGDDTLDGGTGLNTVSYAGAAAGVHVDLTLQGQAQATGGAGSDLLSNFQNIIGSAYNDTLVGDGNNNLIQGGAGDDTIQGGAGNDTIQGGAGADFLQGGSGQTTFVFNTGDVGAGEMISATGTAIIDVQSTTDFSGLGSCTLPGGTQLLLENEGTTATFKAATLSGAWTLQGGEGEQTLQINGTSGDDVINVGGVNADSSWAAGKDLIVIDGGAGNDSITGPSATAAKYLGGDGNDTLVGGIGNDTFLGGSGANVITGGGGTNTVTYAGAGAAVSVDLSDATHGGGGYAHGSGFTDVLNDVSIVVGSSYADTIKGGVDACTLYGGSGADSITGGSGSAVINGGSGADILLGGSGTTTFVFSTGDVGSGETITAQGSATLETHDDVDFTGASAITVPDTLTLDVHGEDAVVNLRAMAITTAHLNPVSNDAGQVINIYGESDTQAGDNIDLTVFNTSQWNDGSTHDGMIHVYAEAGNDTIDATGVGGPLDLHGGDGDDLISAGAGSNTISGGWGSDTLIGGTGSNTFVFDNGDLGGQESVLLKNATANIIEINHSGDSFGAGVISHAGQGQTGTDLEFQLGAGISATVSATYLGAGFNVSVNGHDDSAETLTVAGTSGDDTILGGQLGYGEEWHYDSVALHSGMTEEGDKVVFDGGAGNDVLNLGGLVTVWDNGTSTQNLTAGLHIAASDTAGSGSVTYEAYHLAGDMGTLISTSRHIEYANIESLVGGAGNDTFTGGTGADVFAGMAGNDSILGGAGNDYLAGGGADTQGSYGNDTIDGGAGDDHIIAAGGDNFLYGGAGNDSISAGSGHNYIDGGAGDDQILSVGAATIYGGDGADQIMTQGAESSIDGGAGADSISATGGGGTIHGGGGADQIALGGSGDNVLVYTAQSDIASGEVISGAVSSDTLQLNTTDALDFSCARGIQGFGNLALGGDSSTPDSAHFDNSQLAALMDGGQISFDGNISHAQTLIVTTASAGATTMNFSGVSVEGADDLISGDTIIHDAIVLTGGSGSDAITGSSIDDVISGGMGCDTFAGGANGSYGDTLTYAGETGSMGVVIHADSTGLSGSTGNAVDTYGGRDSIAGGFERLIGSGNNDTLYLDHNYTSILGSLTGIDLGGGVQDTVQVSGVLNLSTASYSAMTLPSQMSMLSGMASGTLGFLDGVENIVLDGSSSSVTLGVNCADASTSDWDVYAQGDNAHILAIHPDTEGTVDLRSITFHDWDDSRDLLAVFGSSGADVIKAPEVATQVYADAGDDTVLGGSHADLIDMGFHSTGSDAGHDSISGGAGNDTINAIDGGGLGQLTSADSVDGGAGADTLYYMAAATLVGGTGTQDFGSGGGTDLQNVTGVENITVSGMADTYIKASSGLLTGLANNLLTVDASALLGGLHFDASALTNVTTSLNVTGSAIHGNAILGAAGNDTLTGGSGNDALSGGSGNDSIAGHGGDDTLDGGVGNDTLIGGSGNDSITGGSGDDSIVGHGGHDTLDGGAGTDTLDLSYATGNLVFDLANTGSQLAGGGVTITQSNFENVIGSAYADTIYGSTGANVINGGAGDDILHGRGGGDTISGGAGTDTVHYDDISGLSGLHVDLAGGTATYTVSATGYTDHLSGVENVYGTTGADTIAGDAADNTFNGFGSHDMVTGSGDSISGGAGSDTVDYSDLSSSLAVGIDANLDTGEVLYSISNVAHQDTLAGIENLVGTTLGDSLTGDSGDNVIAGRGSTETVVLSNLPDGLTHDGSTALLGFVGDVLTGGDGTDTVSYEGLVTDTGGVTIDLSNRPNDFVGAYYHNASGNHMDVLYGFENVIGSGGADSITGDENDNVLTGGAGADTIDGGSGALNIVDYSKETGTSGVVLNGDGLHDTFGDVDTLINIQGLVLNDASANLDFSNSILAQWMDASSGTFKVDASAMTAGQALTTTGGELSHFSLYAIGGAGDDNLGGGSAADTLIGGAGNDTLNGGLGGDSLDGGAGNDTLQVYGDSATLVGGAGADYLQGGADTNLYIYNTGDVAQGESLHFANGGSVASENIVRLLSSTDFSGLTGIERQGSMVNASLDFSQAATAVTATFNAAVFNTGAWKILGDSGALLAQTLVLNATGTQTISNLTFQSWTSGQDSVAVNGSDDADVLTITNVDSTLTVSTGAGADTVSLSGEDTLDSTTILTGAGDDAIALSGYANYDKFHINAGAGTDTVSFAASPDGVTFNLGGALAGSATTTGVEFLVGSGHNDTLTGDAGDNTIDGGLGDDSLSGGGGTDTVRFGYYSTSDSQFHGATAGVVVDLSDGTASGGAGDDTLSGFANVIGTVYHDQITGDSGDNVINGMGAAYDQDASGPNQGHASNPYQGDTLDGGAGTDTVSFHGWGDFAPNVGVYVDISNPSNGYALHALNGGDGPTYHKDILYNFENVIGSEYADTIIGGAGANVLKGMEGDDSIVSGGGADTIDGGVGTDTLSLKGITASSYMVVNLSDSAVTPSSSFAGTSWSTAAAAHSVVYSDGSGSTQMSVTNIENVTGTAQSELFIGSSGDNTFAGLGGSDTIWGGGGTDTVDYSALSGGISLNLASTTADAKAGAAYATVTYSGGADHLYSIENIVGTGYADMLAGDANANRIVAGAGDDTVYGGSGGLDTLYGGVVGTSGHSAAGTDTITYANSASGVVVDLSANIAKHATGIDTLYDFANVIGTQYADKITGDGGDNVISGQGDSLGYGDTLDGGGGTNTVTYADVALTGGVTTNLGHTDSDGYSTVTYVLNGHETTDLIKDFTNIIGTTKSDCINGDSGDNIITGLGSTEHTDDGSGLSDGSAAHPYLGDLLAGGNNQTGVGVDGNDTVSYLGLATYNGTGVTLNLGATLIDAYNGVYSEAIYRTADGNYHADRDFAFTNVIGSTGADSITGTTGDNVLEGLGSTAHAAGHGGSVADPDAGDTLAGGGGTDTVSYAHFSGNGGGVSLDLSATAGDGYVAASYQDASGHYHTDHLYGFTNVTGSASADAIRASEADDGAPQVVNVINAGAGNDTVIAGFGADTYHGGEGTDTLDFSQAYTSDEPVHITVTDSNLISTGAGPSVDGFEHIIGGGGDDSIVNQSSATMTLEGGLGADTLTGGGSDTLSYEHETGGAGVTVSLTALSATDSWGDADNISGGGFVNLTGSAYADNLTGTSGANVIMGLAGDDTIIATAGADTIDGGAGTDTLNYQPLDHTLTVNMAGGGAGTVRDWDIGSTQVFSNIEYIKAGAGVDTVSYQHLNADSGVTLDLGSVDANGYAAASYTLGGHGVTDHFAGFEMIIGSAQSDSITGDSGNNVIEGFGGNDILHGGGGTDTISFEHASQGVIFDLTFTVAQTVAIGYAVMQDGFASVAGSAYADHLAGDDNANVINAGAGNDTVFASLGNDTLSGSDGTDIVSFANLQHAVMANYGGGHATVFSADGNTSYSQVLEGFEGMIGTAYADTLIGGSSGSITAGAGDDTIVAGAGAHTVDGGAGTDLFTVSNFNNMTVDVTAHGTGTMSDGDDADAQTFTGIEYVQVGAGGAWSYEHLAAGSGVTLDLSQVDGQGFVHADYTWAGQSVSDHFSGAENIIGSSLADSITGDASDNILEGGGGADTLHGGDGTDTISFAHAGAGVTFDLSVTTAQTVSTGYVVTQDGFESVTGSSHADHLTGDANANVITAGAGDDTITAGAGADTISGGAGTDTLDFSHTSAAYYGVTVNLSSAVVGGAAAGSAHLYDASFTETTQTIDITSGNEIENIIGTTASMGDRLVGNDLNNVINGMGGNDNISGGAGNDTIFDGLGGNTTIDGGVGTDTVTYESSSYSVYVDLINPYGAEAKYNYNPATLGYLSTSALSNIENVTGSSHDDTIFGDKHANYLDGGAGNDTLSGSYESVAASDGQDTLHGGAGNDMFHFDDVCPYTTLIDDFTHGQDKIELCVGGSGHGYFGALGSSVTDGVNFFTVSDGQSHSGSSATASLTYDSSTHTLYYDADGTGGHPAMAVATVQSGATVTASDISLTSAEHPGYC